MGLLKFGRNKDSRTPANDSPAQKALEVGDVMPAGHLHAGQVYMGVEERTGMELYISPKDERWAAGLISKNTFKRAMHRASKVGGKIPTERQIEQIYKNMEKGALKGTFKKAGEYWSFSERRLRGFSRQSCRLNFSNGSKRSGGLDESTVGRLRLVWMSPATKERAPTVPNACATTVPQEKIKVFRPLRFRK